jgi:hypothetical protein
MKLQNSLMKTCGNKGGNMATFIVRIDDRVANALLRNNIHKTAESVLSDIIQKGSEEIADTSYETIGPMKP